MADITSGVKFVSSKLYVYTRTKAEYDKFVNRSFINRDGCVRVSERNCKEVLYGLHCVTFHAIGELPGRVRKQLESIGSVDDWGFQRLGYVDGQWKELPL